MNKKTLPLIIFVLVIAVGALMVGIYFFSYQTGYDIGHEQGNEQGYEEGKAVGRAAAQIEAAKAVSNPMENMPSANPFEEVVNPFEEGYTNPFE